MPKKKKSDEADSSEKDVLKKENNDNSDKSEEKKIKPIKNPVRLLVFLIILLVIVNLLTLYAYYKPDLGKVMNFFKFKTANAVNDSKCPDGTLDNKCSKNKPYYCYQKELVKKAGTCGCPEGYEKNFQDCQIISSS
jgi:hypothetical protein